MQINQPLPMLAGLSPQEFMAQYWQKKPLLIKGAFKDFKPVLSRAELFKLAAREDVYSRLVKREGPQDSGDDRARSARSAVRVDDWSVVTGPINARAKPAFTQKDWTLLVQGVNLYVPQAAKLLSQFRFIPDARLDDVMISYAATGGGVGPHFDSYDVFLIQASGERLWRIGKQKDLRLREDTALKILENFTPQKKYVLSPGDMLYLPPKYAHDGVAVNECMTYSVGFRAPKSDDLVAELLQRLGDAVHTNLNPLLYSDPLQSAVQNPAEIPVTLKYFALKALAKAIDRPKVFEQLLGEMLTEPKDHVWFESTQRGVLQAGRASAKIHPLLRAKRGVVLDDKTKMLYDERFIFINAESWRASGKDRALMRLLANKRALGFKEMSEASAGALDLLTNWADAGWLHIR